MVIQDDDSYKFINGLYSWSQNPNGPFDSCKVAGSATDNKYSEFNYLGKKYYYYRCTVKGLEVDNSMIYVKVNTTGVIYKITVTNGEAKFERQN